MARKKRPIVRVMSALTFWSIWIIFALVAGTDGVRTYGNWRAAQEILRDPVTADGKNLGRHERQVITDYVQSKYHGTYVRHGTVSQMQYSFKTHDGREIFGSAESDVSLSIPESRFHINLVDESREVSLPLAPTAEASGKIRVHYARNNPQLHVPFSIGYLKQMAHPWPRFVSTYGGIAAGIGLLYWLSFSNGKLKRRVLRWLGLPVPAGRRR